MNIFDWWDQRREQKRRAKIKMAEAAIQERLARQGHTPVSRPNAQRQLDTWPGKISSRPSYDPATDLLNPLNPLSPVSPLNPLNNETFGYHSADHLTKGDNNVQIPAIESHHHDTSSPASSFDTSPFYDSGASSSDSGSSGSDSGGGGW